MKNSQAQLDNLLLSAPYRFNSETAREAGKKGAKASQAARKRNKTMAQLAKQIAEARVESADIQDQLKELGLTDEETWACPFPSPTAAPVPPAPRPATPKPAW